MTVDRAQQAADAIAALGDATPAQAKRALNEYSNDDLIAALATSGGGPGGAQAVMSATVPAAHADIIAWPSTPIELVAAPGSGSMILPIFAFLVCDTTQGAYEGIEGGGIIRLGLDDGGSAYSFCATLDEAIGQVSNVLAASSIAAAVIGPAGVARASASAVDLWGNAHAQDPSAYDGQPLYIALTQSDEEPLTAGNAANTLTTTVLYTVVTL